MTIKDRLFVQLDKRERVWIERQAKMEDRSMSAYVRRLIVARMQVDIDAVKSKEVVSGQ